MNLFGFQFPFTKEELKDKQEDTKSFAPPIFDDGAINIENARGIGGSHFNSQYVDIDGSYKNDTDLIVRYRSMSVHPEIDTAIEEITNEAIVTDEIDFPVKLILDDLDYTENTKNKIFDEFEHILNIMDFRTKGYDYFRRWYIDARMYFHTIIDENNPGEGIKEIRYIDPMNMKKVRELEKKVEPKTGIETITIKKEFYVYNKTIVETSNPQTNRGTGLSVTGVKISPDVIVYITSGLYDPQKRLIYGYLHKAIRPLNQLKMMEDSVVIYRLARAPERRAFYVDVGNLPKPKAEQYMKELINRYRNKLVYDANTGEVRDDRRYMSVLEDYWLPRREGSKGTEITTLPGACLAMDTKVPLLDGRELTIAEITEEFNQGKILWAYSCDPITGAVVPGLITWAGVTHKSAKVMKLTLDDGQLIICTPDHKFPIYSKGFVRADELNINSSLIPFHNKREVISLSKIEYLDNQLEVGTLTIDGNEIYHNHHTFALSCGIFTKNSNIGQLEDLTYFLKKLSKALNIPYSRVESEQKSFQIGHSTEISRDEIKFAKFIERLRTKFSELFYQLLKKQLILKGILTEEEWEEDFKRKAHFNFIHDMYFSELKELEVRNERLNSLTMIEPFIGKFFSAKWVRKNILRQNDHDMALIDIEMEEEQLEAEEKADEEQERNAMLGIPPNGSTGIPGAPVPGAPEEMPPEEGTELPPPEPELPSTPTAAPHVKAPSNKYGNTPGKFPRL